ncbi:class I lanthipeptide [Chitinophaga nivalis]|uniref:Class I lanthipeptide n=1 Tax=Chitinophaga nivalis TaxID=2991709 RepID=A0ABT3ILB8_9BACT|nr:class I lanthipeptide [Chitinophaga nivalis]MCW3465555.1 class I lanthipeptide [Chitinophaga nivalis]MCW3484754.1 class I lanthipeptide [Chitinophaga nivalis]
MKKKQITLDKKLFLSKAAIASLSSTHQLSVEGGVNVSGAIRCFTRDLTCATVRPGERLCRMCEAQ